MLYRKSLFLMSVLLLCLGLISACGASGLSSTGGVATLVPTHTPAVTATHPSLSLLQTANQTMNALQAISYQSKEIDKYLQPDVPPVPSGSVLGALGLQQNQLPLPGSGQFTIDSTGNVLLPDKIQEQNTVTLNQPGSGSNFNEFPKKVLNQGTVYVLDDRGNWFQLDQDFIQSQPDLHRFAENYWQEQQQIIALLIQKGEVQSKGQEMLQGKSVTHLVVTLGLSSLSELQAQHFFAQLLVGTTNPTIDAVHGDFDIWIENSTSYILQLGMDLRYHVKASNQNKGYINEAQITQTFTDFNHSRPIPIPLDAYKVTNINDPKFFHP